MGFSIGGWHPFSGGIIGTLELGTINGQSVLSGGLAGVAQHLEAVANGINVSILGSSVGGALNTLTDALDAPIIDATKWIDAHKACVMAAVVIVGAIYLGPFAYAAWESEIGADAVADGIADASVIGEDGILSSVADVAPDVVADVAPDVVADVAPDVIADVAPDVVADVAPDTLDTTVIDTGADDSMAAPGAGTTGGSSGMTTSTLGTSATGAGQTLGQVVTNTAIKSVVGLAVSEAISLGLAKPSTAGQAVAANNATTSAIQAELAQIPGSILLAIAAAAILFAVVD
jgi:hypothetical protein